MRNRIAAILLGSCACLVGADFDPALAQSDNDSAWSGFYVSGLLGLSFQRDEYDGRFYNRPLAGIVRSANATSATIGGRIGMDYTISGLLFGIGAEVHSAIGGSAEAGTSRVILPDTGHNDVLSLREYSTRASATLNGFAALPVKFGFVLSSHDLLYVKGGPAIGSFSLMQNITSNNQSGTVLGYGYLVGVGYAHMIRENVSFFAEANLIQLETELIDDPNAQAGFPRNIRLESQIVSFQSGISVHF